MDIGARRLGLDPAEIRRRNSCGPPRCLPPRLTYKDGVPITYDPGDFPRPSSARSRSFPTTTGTTTEVAGRRRAPNRRRLACYAQGTGSAPTRRDRAGGPERQGLRLHRRDGPGARATRRRSPRSPRPSSAPPGRRPRPWRANGPLPVFGHGHRRQPRRRQLGPAVAQTAARGPRASRGRGRRRAARVRARGVRIDRAACTSSGCRTGP